MRLAAPSLCRWCETAFPPKRHGGAAKAFCGDRCRATFHAAARRHAARAVARGEIPVAMLRALAPPCIAAPEMAYAPSPDAAPDPSPLPECPAKPDGAATGAGLALGGATTQRSTAPPESGGGTPSPDRATAIEAGGVARAGGNPQSGAAPVFDMDELQRQAAFLRRRQPPDPGHESYCRNLVVTIYAGAVWDMLRAGLITAERAIELGIEDTL